MELSWSPRIQATNNAPKPHATSFFPLWKPKDNQPAPKAPAIHLVHLEEEGTGGDEEEGVIIPMESMGLLGNFVALGQSCKGHPN